MMFGVKKMLIKMKTNLQCTLIKQRAIKKHFSN